MVLNKHPSKDITGTAGEALKGKRVVLCVTGSVAAVRCSEIARGLMRYGAEVFAVMSEMARKIIHPYLMEWATGNPVVTELTGKVEHVALVGERTSKADLVLVAPATANTISKIACGIDDTPVTSVVSTAFGSGIPIMIVPAMHESMYRHPIVAENIEKLKALDVEFVGPRIEEEKAKIAENSEILEAVIKRLTMRKDLARTRVLITAGPTLEHIDPVRVMTNKSSGKMGVAVAREALNRGADVTLVSGPGTAMPPSGAKVIPVETTKEMLDAVVSELKSKKYDVVVAAAAAADWRPEKSFDYKVSTGDVSELLVKLRPTQKHIDPVRVMTNKSSGKMGVAVAREALNRGADVTLVYGPGTALPPSDAKVIPVETTEEMLDAVVSELKSKKYDVVVAAAAVADWRPEKSFDYKVSTGDVSELLVKLRPTQKIIDAVRKVSTDVFLVPFKAEYDLSDEELVERGFRRLVEAEADMIVVNDVGREGTGFGVDTNEVFIVDKDTKVVHVPLTTKTEVARRIFDVITEKMNAR